MLGADLNTCQWSLLSWFPDPFRPLRQLSLSFPSEIQFDSLCCGIILCIFVFLHREEASELCQTLEVSEGRERTVSEMADVLYHSMVLLSVQDVKMEEVMATLRKRFSQSGIEEKSKRPPKPTAD